MHESSKVASRFDLWKFAQFAVLLLLAAIAFWRLVEVDFHWRAVLADLSPWSFFFAMATLPVFGFPISACYIYAGLAFEPAQAIAACIGALAVNLSASYIFAKYLFRKPIERLLKKRDWKLPVLKEDNQFRFAFALRTIPGPPFFFQNLILSLIGIPFFTYLWVSLLAQGAISVVVVLSAREISQSPGSIVSRSLLVVLGALLVAKVIKEAINRRKKS